VLYAGYARARRFLRRLPELLIPKDQLMIDSAEVAKELAQDYLDTVIQPQVDEEVTATEVREFPTCWVVGYNTRAFLETGSFSHALVGGGPIIINRGTGRLRVGTSALPAEEQLDPA
jgi:Immunity protein 35